MTLEEKISKYKEYREKIVAFEFAMYMISWDSETIAPTGCFEERGNQVGVLSKMSLEFSHSDEYINIVKDLYDNSNKLDKLLRIEIKKVYKDIMRELKVPVDELVAYSTLSEKAYMVWMKAKLNNDYDSFAPILKQIIDFNKKLITYYSTDTLKGYDVLLDLYEEGMTVEKYDEFFNLLKKELVPLVKKISNLNIKKPEWVDKKFSVEKQKEFARYIMDVMCFNQECGIMAESEHPFTSGFKTTDVRVTNHYYENMVLSSVFSIIHELGHATYEQQCDPILNDTLLFGGTTMAMHESQSRFYENIIGRSYPFWQRHYKKLKSIFKKELKDVSLDEFYKFVNYCECSLIRTEADELTYPLHIMVRYELEKKIFSQDIDVADLPKMWNDLYKEYLGIDVPTNTLGILQDVHWAGGSFGYFPTYALGSAYGAQLLNTMKKEFDVDKYFGAKNLSKVNAWLKKNVHKYGQTKTPKEILLLATKEEFNPKYYVEYLKDKFTKIYNLD